MQTEEPFAFAGIWSLVHDAQGVVQPTFAILTTEANALVAQIHTRMPVILREQDEEEWLTPSLSLDAAQALLVPFLQSGSWRTRSHPRSTRRPQIALTCSSRERRSDHTSSAACAYGVRA